LSVADAFRRVRDRVAEAALRAGRAPADVTVCAVTKTIDLPAIREAVEAGARVLGENRIQEAADKIPAASDLDAAWHLIGHLQRNKARRATELFDVIESVDSLRLAERLSELGEERAARIPVLVEVLTSAEGTKSGVELDRAGDLLARIAALPGVELRGLMTMAPFTDDEAAVRASFAALRGVREQHGRPEWDLSMGMSGDFEAAVEEGSTLVRVGRAIFG
jgi:hypothetical protein